MDPIHPVSLLKTLKATLSIFGIFSFWNYLSVGDKREFTGNVALDVYYEVYIH